MEQRVRVHSTDPLTTVFRAAATWSMKPSQLTYKIISFSTSFTTDGESWKDIGEKDMGIFEDDEFYLNPKLQLSQDYKIEIHPKLADENYIEVELVENKSQTELKARFKANEGYVFKNTLAIELMQEIYKKMIHEGYFIALRMFEFKKELLKAANYIKKNGIKEDIEITIAKGIPAIQPTPEHIVYDFEKKYDFYKDDVSYQGYAVDVFKDEVIARRVKPFRGRVGRDLKFRLIQILPLRVDDELDVKFNAAKIQEVDTPTCYEYKALQSGYMMKNRVLDIKSELQFSSVDFKTTGSIYLDLDNDIKISVIKPNPMDEAVKSRINLRAKTIEIVGNVGQDVSLVARNLSLDGTTHTKCKIEADEAYIKNLRCEFRGLSLRADTVDNADIEADIVVVKKAVGGVIKANKIYVDELHGSCECIARELIVIGKCQGQNRLQIKGHQHEKQADGTFIDLVRFEQELLGDEVDLPRKLKVLKSNIALNRPSIKLLEKKLKSFQSIGKVPPKTYTLKIKAYNEMVKEYNALLHKLQGLGDHKANIQTRLRDAQESILETMMINTNGAWSEGNEISFELFYPKEDQLIHLTAPFEDAKCFKVVRDETAGKIYKIAKKDEYDEILAKPPKTAS